MRNPLLFKLFFPYRKDVISVSLVSRRCFGLVFRSLTEKYLGADFFEFSYLEFIQLLESVGLCILPSLRHFQLSFLCVLLKSYLLSPFFETLMTGVLEIFYYSPSSPWDSIHFYFVCFLSVVVIFQSSSSLVFPSYSFYFAVECISQVLIFPLLHFSILLALHVSYFFAETISLLRLPIYFVCFKHVYWSIFKLLAALQSRSHSINIPVVYVGMISFFFIQFENFSILKVTFSWTLFPFSCSLWVLCYDTLDLI